jgi:hypothetical protein
MTESGSKVVEFQRSDESEGFITNTHENIVDLYNKKMAEYAQEFQTQSQGLMSYIQGQLSSVVSWTALPGQLNKIVVSPTGFVWGFNVNGDVYTCKEPCDGANWKYVGPPPSMVGLPLDIVVDDQNVYILYNSQSATKPGCPAGGKGITSVKTSGGYNIRLYTKSECDSIGGNWIGNGARNWGMKTDKVGECYGRPGGNASFCSTDQSPSPEAAAAAGESVSSSASPGVSLAFSLKPVDDSGSWQAPKAIPGIPPANPTINITDQFIFVGSQGCSKPCTTGSWVPISQPAGSQGIVAASSGNTYALAAAGNGEQKIYQSSGNGQGGWSEQAGLSGVMPLAVGADSQFIIGVDQSSRRPLRCSPPYTEDDSCQVDSTFTNRPMAGSHTVSVNPRSYQTYVAASSSGTVGNLYQRVDPGSIDNSGVLDDTRQYLSEMDSSVNALGTATSTQDAQIQVGKVKQAANSVIKKISDIREERENTAAERDRIKRKIQTVGGPPSEYRMKILQTITITLALVLLSYFILGLVLPPWINMSIAVVGMLVGLGFAISFAVNKQ